MQAIQWKELFNEVHANQCYKFSPVFATDTSKIRSILGKTPVCLLACLSYKVETWVKQCVTEIAFDYKNDPIGANVIWLSQQENITFSVVWKLANFGHQALQVWYLRLKSLYWNNISETHMDFCFQLYTVYKVLQIAHNGPIDLPGCVWVSL